MGKLFKNLGIIFNNIGSKINVDCHRRNLCGVRGVPLPFWTEVYRYSIPHFSGQKVKNLLSPAVNRSGEEISPPHSTGVWKYVS